MDRIGAPSKAAGSRELEPMWRYERNVLTEWKNAETSTEAIEKFEEARRQAARYAQGPLATTELRRYRYAVIVTPSRVDVPPDATEGGVVYRHVNVAVAPASPSQGARKKTKRLPS